MRPRASSRPVRLLAALAMSVCLALGMSPLWAKAQTTDCRLYPDFVMLRDQVGPRVVGECGATHVMFENGDVHQRTTAGEFVRRKTDGVVAFTNGDRTWLLGPNGLQERSNSDRFDWEQQADSSTAVAPTPQPTSIALAGSVDPALRPAIDAIRSINILIPDKRIGDGILRPVDQLGTQVVVGPLSRGLLGRYIPGMNMVTINATILAEDPRVVATVLAHELTHARQVLVLGDTMDRDCIHMEVEAFKIGAATWWTLWNGQPPIRTSLEEELTDWTVLLTNQGEPGLYKRVVDEPGYQQECELFVPSGTAPTIARPQTSTAPQVAPTATPVPRPTATATPELPPDQTRKFDGHGDSTTRPFALRGGTYVIKWQVRLSTNADYSFCFIGGFLEHQTGGDLWDFQSESAEKGKTVRGETHVSRVPAGSYVLEVNSYGDGCSWTVTVDSDN